MPLSQGSASVTEGSDVTVLPGQPDKWLFDSNTHWYASDQNDTMLSTDFIGCYIIFEGDASNEYSFLFRDTSFDISSEIRQSLYVWSDANSRFELVDSNTSTDALDTSSFMAGPPVSLPSSSYTGEVSGVGVIMAQVSSSNSMQIARRSVDANFDVTFTGVRKARAYGTAAPANFTVTTYENRLYHTVYRSPSI